MVLLLVKVIYAYRLKPKIGNREYIPGKEGCVGLYYWTLVMKCTKLATKLPRNTFGCVKLGSVCRLVVHSSVSA